MMMEKLENLNGEFFTRLDDLTNSLEEEGFGILEANREYVVVDYHDEDTDEYVQVQLHIGGTERTMIVESYEEVCRD